MKKLIKYLFLFHFILTCKIGFTQNIHLKIISTLPKNFQAKFKYKERFFTQKEALNEVDYVILAMRKKGYLLASLDSMQSDSLNLTAFIAENGIYKVANLKLGNLNPNLASKLGVSEKMYLNKSFNYKDVTTLFEKIIVYYENNGYPFVSVGFDSVRIAENSFSATLNVTKNKLFKIDSIKIEGNSKINKSFLYKYLSIKENMPYNEAMVSNISQKLRQLSFVTEKQPPLVRLTDKTNKLILFLDKKNASQFDGIIGFLPDANTKKTVITGDIKLKVINGVFRNGETFDLEWRRLQSQTQDFKGHIIYPFLFGTPIGTDYQLKIYRRDTSFIDVNNNIGLQYYFAGLNSFKIFYKQKNTNLISTSGLKYVTLLPDYADIAIQSYGSSLNFEKFDYRFNPHKGFSVNILGQTGARIIKKNANVNEVAYRNLLLKSTQYQFEGDLNYFIQLHKNNVLKLAIQGATIFGNSSIFKNELFRIGGLKTLRGFDEESIFASTYIIPTIEYRFLFSQNSNLLLFSECAWYENNSNIDYLKDTPISFGAGINFETKAGILTLNYALGKQLNNSFDLRNGKIHFGLTALF